MGDGQKVKDWHDKEAIKRDAQRVGTENGSSHGRVPWKERAYVCVFNEVSGPPVDSITPIPSPDSEISPLTCDDPLTSPDPLPSGICPATFIGQ